MQFRYSSTFKKQYRRLPKGLQKQFDERLILMCENPTHSLLRVHPLHGKYHGYWSMNVSGDVRTIYKMDGDEVILFALIGTHSSLYG